MSALSRNSRADVCGGSGLRYGLDGHAGKGRLLGSCRGQGQRRPWILPRAREAKVGGEIGNLRVKGDSTRAYYWNQHEKTKATLFGEWIHTGDEYYQDADGYFWYCGRADDMLKVGQAATSTLEDELKGFVKVKLAPYQYPRWIEFVPALSKTATGKIQRFKLR